MAMVAVRFMAMMAVGISHSSQLGELPVEAVEQEAGMSSSMDSPRQIAIFDQLATMLEENYVFPDVGTAYASRLRQLVEEGGYTDVGDDDAFAARLTADLLAVHPDGHLRVMTMRPPPSTGEPQRSTDGFTRESNTISKMGWLLPGTAYIRFEAFPGNEATMAALEAFLQEHASAERLIIDTRTHRGGGRTEMDLLFPMIFAETRDLLVMEMRLAPVARRPVEEHAQNIRIDGPEGTASFLHRVVPTETPVALAKARVFVLTSSRTVSGGEHLAFALKQSGRATIMGETTRGAGHFGGVTPIGEGFAAFIPIGRTYDPATGEGWEGNGVTPHIAVPADEALDEVLRREGLQISAEDALASLD